ITVYASQAGKLDAFFDWNDDGDWDEPGEEVFDSLVLAAGANTLTVNVDPLVVAGNNITSRFRISPIGSPNLGSTGLAFSIGEVEDYTTIAVPPRDYGDAPASYGSASHTLVPSASFPILGPSVDVDTGDWHNGTDTSTMALDDDNEGFVPDDEAGVTWVAGDVRRGESFDIQVTVANATGRLNAWFDWNENGVFAGAEQVFTDVVLGVGTHTLTVNVPANARTVENPGAAGATYARFRIDTAGGLGATGLAPDGEVEDYKFLVNQAYDYGDAPDLPYETDLIGPVTLNPARHLLHVTPNLYLGAGVDSELDGQPSVIADGDDTDSVNPSANDLADDEDGVVFKDVLTRGLVSTIDVILPALSPGGILNAWIDFDASGTFDPAENLFGNQPVVAGTNTLTFLVPASATLVDSYARFRLSTAGSLTPAGTAADGEIEDYRVSIHDPISITGRKFEDRNLDGVRNPGEPYLAGWDIQLLDEDNNVLSTATTINVGPDPDTQHGIYTFTNVRPLTTYRVREVINASPLFNNWVATAPDFTGGSGLLLEIESNDTLATAQEIPQSTFQVGNQFNTQDSKVARHVTISGKGDGSVDHYELVVPQDNTRVVLDIDFGDQAGSPATSFDSYLELFTDTGNLITLNDDSLISDGAGGSTSGLDSFIDTTLDSGTYIIRVSDLINTTIATGKTYNLQVSLYDSPYELFQAPGANATGIDFGNRLRESDFGDAPNSYQTVVASNGPRHQITNLYLGSSVDSDLDGQPTAAADGDDVDAFFTAPDDVANDDDGVILAALIPGAAAHPVTVLASQTGGYLNAWIDFNKDGDFADAGEKIFTDVALVGGANNLTFPVPAAASGPTYARFRLSTQTGLGPGGFALDGEVEDYRVNVTAAQPLRFDFGPTGSPIESGYNLVSKATVYPGAGFGWSTGTVDDRDRGAPTDLTRDFGFSTDATFSANVSNGTYNVIATFGDNAFAHNNVGVFVEGNQVDTVSTTAGQFVTRTYVGVPVVDGKLDLRIAALPGGTTAVINALQIVPTVATY
ncbi:MAG: hypothetical protein KDA99_27200, partial [Planctomycetales bacterium]|nr:hypothetical protein [Planctomycetales bacterium]